MYLAGQWLTKAWNSSSMESEALLQTLGVHPCVSMHTHNTRKQKSYSNENNVRNL